MNLRSASTNLGWPSRHSRSFSSAISSVISVGQVPSTLTLSRSKMSPFRISSISQSCAGLRLVVREHLGEAVVLVEVLVRIELAALDTRAQMEIAHDQADQLHLARCRGYALVVDLDGGRPARLRGALGGCESWYGQPRGRGKSLGPLWRRRCLARGCRRSAAAARILIRYRSCATQAPDDSDGGAHVAQRRLAVSRDRHRLQHADRHRRAAGERAVRGRQSRDRARQRLHQGRVRLHRRPPGAAGRDVAASIATRSR